MKSSTTRAMNSEPQWSEEIEEPNKCGKTDETSEMIMNVNVHIRQLT